MAVRLRLQREGAAKDPFYRVVAIDRSKARNGRFIEMLGTYDPEQKPAEVRLRSDRVEYWLGVGAQPSETVESLVRRMRRGEVIDLDEERTRGAATAEGEADDEEPGEPEAGEPESSAPEGDSAEESSGGEEAAEEDSDS